MNIIEQDTVPKELVTQPVRLVVSIQPVTDLLPKISPIHDLLASTHALERGNRIYSLIAVCVLLILLVSLVTGLINYFRAFYMR